MQCPYGPQTKTDDLKAYLQRAVPHDPLYKTACIHMNFLLNVELYLRKGCKIPDIKKTDLLLFAHSRRRALRCTVRALHIWDSKFEDILDAHIAYIYSLLCECE